MEVTRVVLNAVPSSGNVSPLHNAQSNNTTQDKHNAQSTTSNVTNAQTDATNTPNIASKTVDKVQSNVENDDPNNVGESNETRNSQNSTNNVKHNARNRKPRTKRPKMGSERPDACMILVSGYPEYTQQQDLTRAFSRFGNVKIESFHPQASCLSFPIEDEAKAAILAAKKVHIYGDYVTIMPYNPNAVPTSPVEEKPQTPKREFPMTKQKGVTVSPQELQLSGEFHRQAERVLGAVRLQAAAVARLAALYRDLQAALQHAWPGCTAIPFGSITTGLGTKTSDADCFVDIPPQFRHPNANLVNKAKRILLQYPQTFTEILSIPRANTPIVKFYHIPTGTNCDVSFKTLLGVQNSKLIAFLLQADPRLLPIAVIIKYWAKVHDLSGTGKLTNYALTMMIIFYLQQPQIGILPSITWLQKDRANDFIVDGWNTGFMCNYEALPHTTNTSSIADLLGGFFEYYSMFNFEEMVVCPYLGIPFKKELFKDLSLLPNEYEIYKNNVSNLYSMPMKTTTAICIQDPFEQSHNVASCITSRLAADIKVYFKFAANAYEKGKLNKCQEFLSTILLQKPKLVRAKSNPEYRVNLFHKIIANVVEGDWKSVIRDVILTIFEKMLKIKLGKVEEKVNPDTKKQKEKYMGSVTKAIWKRKQFSKLYSLVNLKFDQKQARITEEILNVEKEKIDIQFQLTVTYCHEPSSSVVSVKLSNGDVMIFREFGKFFVSVMQNWVLVLLKPHAKAPEKDTAAKIQETMESLNDNDEDDVEENDSDDDSSGKCDIVESTADANSDIPTVTTDC